VCNDCVLDGVRVDDIDDNVFNDVIDSTVKTDSGKFQFAKCVLSICFEQKRSKVKNTISYSLTTAAVVLTCNKSGWPRSLEIRENRENGQNKFPAGKNQGISKFKRNQGIIREFCKK